MMYYFWLRELALQTRRDQNGIFLWNEATKKQLEGTYFIMYHKNNLSKEFRLMCRYYGETENK